VQVPERVERRRLATLPPLAAAAADAALSPPRLPAGAAARVPLAVAAARTALPVTIMAAPGAGRLAIARALHARAARPGPLIAAIGRRPSLDDLPDGATLTLDVTALASETLLVLEALLDDARVWVLACAEPGKDLPPALAPRLAAVTLAVPPLAQRTAEIPALADAMLAATATRLGRSDLAFTAAARARLTGHAWAGDLTELEAVVARAALAASEHAIGEEHLGLDASGGAGTGPAEAADAQLELMLAELAHELRNPLVTIKTYADHLPDMLEDAELRARFATLTGEAIARMDGLLENLLGFARLRAPRRGPLELEPILDRVLAEIEPELAERAVSVRRAGNGDVHCAGDAEHLAYAFRNLFAGVAREVPPRDELLLETTANGVVTIRFAAGAAAASRLRQLVVPNGAGALGDPTLLPLSFRLARDVLERNGGGLTLEERPDEGTILVVQLPATQEESR
jgi:signal transduction histidine kinase